MRIHMEPTQTQHVPFHLGLRNARYTDPSRMIPCGLRGRAPSIQDPPSFRYKKQKHQLSFHHGLRSARCKNPCRMIHCGPRARAPQSGTSRPTCKKNDAKSTSSFCPGCSGSIPPFEWRCPSVLSTRTRLAHLISGLRRFAQGPGAHDNLQHIVFSVPPACPQCFLCCGRAGGSGRGPLTRSN